MNQLIYICVLFMGCYATRDSSTLKQLHVLFRHGDRTPIKENLYPKDPHINDTWYPEGYEQLTLYGKQQEYDIGRALRKRYNKFLGNIYTPDVLEAWTTDINRTKMSLELVLAGLWPPGYSQSWNSELRWQPIPYNYKDKPTDTLLWNPPNCPLYQFEYKRVMGQNFNEWLKTNAETIDFINKHSGLQITSFQELQALYLVLNAEQRTGRLLPKWTKNVFPGFLEETAILDYKSQTFNALLKRLSGGAMLKKILDDTTDKINDVVSSRNRKVILLSGHEFNIVHLQAALDVYKPHIPPYAAYFIVELHRIGGIYMFKVLYQDYTKDVPEYLTIPGCNTFCPFEKLQKFTRNIIPTNITRECSINFLLENDTDALYEYYYN